MKAAYAGLLNGLVGVGPGYSFSSFATRGECAQVLYNLLARMRPANTWTNLSPGTLPAAGVLVDGLRSADKRVIMFGVTPLAGF